MKIKKIHTNSPSQCLILLTLALILQLSEYQANAYTTVGSSTNDGINYDRAISYYTFNGYNGIKAQLDSRSGSSIDFFLRLWIRPDTALQTKTNTTQVYMEIPKSLRCYLNYTNSSTSCSQIKSDSTVGGSINLSLLSLVPNQWIHVALGGSSGNNINFLRVDYSDQIYSYTTSTYVVQMTQNASPWYAYIGANSTLLNGFYGDIREFFFANYYITWSQVANIRNQVIYMNTNQIGNYRFQNGSLSDMFRQTQTSTLQAYSGYTYPTWQYDTLANDMCQIYRNYTLLPKIDYSVMSVSSTSIDSRLNAALANFQYSGSFWMKTMPGLKTTTSAQTARDSTSFFVLGGAFSLWFYDQTSIKMFFHAVKSYYEAQSKSIYFPQGAWANFQFTIDRTNGYEMRVYDFQRRLITTTSESLYLQDQKPSQTFTLFRNFVGYIKQIMVYQAKLTLPLDVSNGNNGKLTDSTLVVYYKFDQSYYSTTSKYLQSLGAKANGEYGSNVYFSGTVTFDVVEWDQTYYFSSPTQIGTLTQTFNLYDGVGCTSTPLLFLTTESTSYINYTVSTLGGAMSQGSIEMWIKGIRGSSSVSYFFSMYSTSLVQEFAALFQDNDYILTCKPFDSQNDTTTAELKYSSYLYSNLYWQHISCSFKSGYDISGMLYTSSDSVTYYYSYDLNTTEMVVPESAYNMMIGNSYNSSYGAQYTYIREVRFWSIYRSTSQIIQYRFLQIDPLTESGLFSYFKMAADEYYVADYVLMLDTTNTSSTSYIAEKYGVVTEVDSGTSINVCPQFSYPQYGAYCYNNPFITHKILLIPQLITTNSVQWRFTSNYSDMASPYAQFANPSVSYLWTTKNSTINNGGFTLNSNDLYLNQTIIKTSTDVFTINQTVNNTAMTAYSEATLTFLPKSCRYVGDSITKAAVREVYYTMPQSTMEVKFNFTQYNYCTTTTDSLAPYVDWVVYPSYLAVTGYSYSYSNVTKVFTLTIPTTTQAYFPTHENVYFIGTVYWNNLTANVTSTSYNSTYMFQNIVYKIKYTELLKPIINATTSKILIGDNMVMLGQYSYSANISDSTQSKNGLSYYWACPTNFTTACDRQRNMRFLNITYDEFLAAGASYSTSYTFTLSVWKGKDPDQAVNYTTSSSVQWLKVAKPSFVIGIQGKSKVIASQSNSFQLELKNYDIYSTELSIAWSLTPSTSTYLSYSSNNTVLTVAKGGFKTSTSYNLTVTITNIYYTLANTTATMTFTTGSGPLSGSASVSPSTGLALSTGFTFSISSWTSDTTPIFFKVTGASTSFSSIPITTRYYYDTETLTTNLTQMSSVTFEIMDSAGEIVYLTKSITVSPNTAISASDTIGQTILNSTQILDSLVATTYQLNQLNSSTTTTIASNKLVELDYLELLSKTFTSSDASSTDTQDIMSKGMVIMALATNGTTSSDIQSSAIDVLYQFMNSTVNFETMMTDTVFQQNYADTVSNILSYYQSAAQTSRRMLASSTSLTNLQTALTMKDIYADNFCKAINSTYYQIQNTISTSMYTLMIERIPSNSRVFNRIFYYPTDLSYMSIPYNELVAAEYALNNSFASTCVQVTFLKINPLTGYTFTNQTLQSSIVMQLNTYNENYTNILKYGDITLTSNNFIQSFQYDFNSTSTTFLNNQTVVEYIYSNLSSYSSAAWTDWYTSYTYQVSSKIVYSSQSKMGPYYLAVITDLGRTYVADTVEETVGFFSLLLEFDPSIIPLLAFLAIFLIVFPITAICKDRTDLAALATDEYPVSEDTLQKIAMRKRQPFDQVVYSKKLYSDYQSMQEVSCFNMFKLFCRNLHPLFSFFIRFDFEFKRLVRFMLLAIQYAGLAFICVIIFGKSYRPDETDDETRTFDSKDKGNAILAGFILSLLLLPFPYTWIECFKSRMLPEEDQPQQEEEEEGQDDEEEDNKDKKKKKQVSDHSDDDYDGSQHEGGEDEEDEEEDEDEEGEGPEVNRQSDNNRPPHTISRLRNDTDEINRKKGDEEYQNSFNIDQGVMQDDRCVAFKIILIIFSLFFILGAIVFAAATSAQVSKPNSKAIVVSYFTAILSGWFLVNIIRIIFNACVAPKYARDEDEEEEHSPGCCQKVFVAHEAILLIRDMLIVDSIVASDPNFQKKKKVVEKAVEKVAEKKPEKAKVNKSDDKKNPKVQQKKENPQVQAQRKRKQQQSDEDNSQVDHKEIKVSVSDVSGDDLPQIRNKQLKKNPGATKNKFQANESSDSFREEAASQRHSSNPAGPNFKRGKSRYVEDNNSEDQHQESDGEHDLENRS